MPRGKGFSVLALLKCVLPAIAKGYLDGALFAGKILVPQTAG